MPRNHHAHTPPTDRGTLHAQPLAAPVVAVDRRWCFPTTTTLHIEESPLTRKIKVRHADNKHGAPLLEIRRLSSPVRDLFHVLDAKTQQVVLTVDGFGLTGCFDVFKGPHEPSSATTKRVRGPILLDAATAHVTVYFDDADAKRPTRAICDGDWGDRAAVVSLHHAVSSQPVARIQRPHHLWLTLPSYTLEVAASVDVLVPLVLWLGRWVQFERARLAAAHPCNVDRGNWS